MKKLVTTLLTATALAACGGANGASSTNGDVTSGLQIKLTSSAAAPAAAKAVDPAPAPTDLALTDMDGTSFMIDTARASVQDIEVDLPEGVECEDSEDSQDSENEGSETLSDDSSDLLTCESETEDFKIRGPFVLDLVAGTSTPDISGLGLPTGVYDRVEIKFEEAEVEDGLVSAEDPLAGNTLYLSGFFKYDPNDTEEVEKTFELALKFSEDAEFANPTGINIDSLSADDLVLNFDVAGWFSALPITSCIMNGDLAVVDNHLMISDSTGDCQNLEDNLKNAIKGSTELDDDHDDDDENESEDESGDDN